MRVNQNGGLIFEKYMSAQNFRILVTGAGMGVIRDRLEKIYDVHVYIGS